MTKPNGRQKRAIEGLAAALQECFDASSELAEKRMEKRNEPRFAKIDDRFEQVDARFEQIDARFEQVDARFEQVDARFEQVDARFDKMETHLGKQDDTLRMIWTQCGGKADQRLPIDD